MNDELETAEKRDLVENPKRCPKMNSGKGAASLQPNNRTCTSTNKATVYSAPVGQSAANVCRAFKAFGETKLFYQTNKRPVMYLE